MMLETKSKDNTTLLVGGVRDEDFVNYKKPSMYLAFPNCTFKCEKECGKRVCQNNTLATSPAIETKIMTVINRYLSNPITKAVVCSGLDPIDSWANLKTFIAEFRRFSEDDIVIYTGYTEEEVNKMGVLQYLKRNHTNIIMKFGRFIPDSTERYDEVLGVVLASDNQYAKRVC